MDQASWVAGIEPAGALFGNICIGYIAKHFGRKKPLHFFTIPMIVSSVRNIVLKKYTNEFQLL